MTVAQALKGYLTSHGIKQTFIAEKCNWPKQKVCCIVNGKQRMSADDFFTICKAIGAPYDLILNASEDERDSA